MPPAYTHTCVFTPLQADNSSNCTNHSRISSKILFSTLSQHELFIVSSPQFLHSIRIRLPAAFHRGSAAPAGSRALLQMPPTGTGCTQPHPVWLTTHPHCRLFSPAFTQTTPVARRRVYIFPVKHQEKKKNRKKAMPWVPAEQESKEYSRNPGNTYGEFSSNEDRALQVQLCSEVVLPKPENKLCITYIISKEGNTTTASPRS